MRDIAMTSFNASQPRTGLSSYTCVGTACRRASGFASKPGYLAERSVQLV
jgi:hypothetical protein